jgi:hypothetical protein
MHTVFCSLRNITPRHLGEFEGLESRTNAPIKRRYVTSLAKLHTHDHTHTLSLSHTQTHTHTHTHNTHK